MREIAWFERGRGESGQPVERIGNTAGDGWRIVASAMSPGGRLMETMMENGAGKRMMKAGKKVEEGLGCLLGRFEQGK
ncbi:hypothetical protein IMZ48_07035 [Candidatus Bathyarchaeota archaeon]|nr:hypothetical protein [Candidatus Bathyarchaeota archaeon]